MDLKTSENSEIAAKAVRDSTQRITQSVQRTVCSPRASRAMENLAKLEKDEGLVVQQLSGLTKSLTEFCSQNKNVHTFMKEAVRKLEGLVGSLEHLFQVIPSQRASWRRLAEEDIGAPKPPKTAPPKDVGIQTTTAVFVDTEKPACCDASVQTGPAGRATQTPAMWTKDLGKGKKVKKVVGKPVPPETQSKVTQDGLPSHATPADEPKVEHTWTEVVRKKKGKSAQSSTGERASKKPTRPPRQRRPNNEAVIVTPAEGTTFVDVLKKAKEGISLKELGVDVKTVRQSRAGDLLIEVPRGNGSGVLATKLKEVLGPVAEVRQLLPTMTLVIMDLDETVEEAQLAEELASSATELLSSGEESAVKAPSFTVKRISSIGRGLRRGVVQVPIDLGAVLLKAGRVRVGWVRCRVREMSPVVRCYRCHGIGHKSFTCKHPADLKGFCMRCGSEGHLASDCKASAICTACKFLVEEADVSHWPGSERCKAAKQCGEEKEGARART